jgi:hypothetical protein
LVGLPLSSRYGRVNIVWTAKAMTAQTLEQSTMPELLLSVGRTRLL